MVDKPLLSSTAESRFKNYIWDTQIDGGETLHVGWTNPKTALCYINLADGIRTGARSDLLASNMSLQLSQEPSRFYADFNMLKKFVTAFPLSVSSLLKRPLRS